MSLRKCFLFVLLTTVFRLVGNQTEPMQQVQVKVGDTAVLPCNVSAYMNGETEDGFYIWWATNGGLVCDFTKGKSYPSDDYHNRTEISKEENSEHLYHLIIKETRLSDEGKYNCKLEKPGGKVEDVASVQLIVQGHEENVSVVFGKTLAIGLPVTESARVRFAPASSSTGADVCTVRQNTLTPASAYASRAALENNELRLDRITFADEGSYSVIDVVTGRVMKTAVLAVEGLVENRELHEGDNLTIPLCCLSLPYIEFCGPAGNSAAEGVCQGHVERLTVQNGSLTLSNFTAKDQGKYIIQEKIGGRVVLTLTLKTKPVDWHWIVGVIAGIYALLLVGISVLAIKWYTKRKMERETRRRAEQLDEQFPLSEIKSSGDVEEKIPLSEIKSSGDVEEKIPLSEIKSSGDVEEKIPLSEIKSSGDVEEKIPLSEIKSSGDVEEKIPLSEIKSSGDVEEKIPLSEIKSSGDVEEKIPLSEIKSSGDVEEKIPLSEIKSSGDVEEKIPLHEIKSSGDVEEK